MNNLLKYKQYINKRICHLRKERRWTQVQFAKLIGLSQSRFSEIERGNGSLTAEQLLVVLQTFNVSLDYFVGENADASSNLQSALVRLGAANLNESQDEPPSEKFMDVVSAVREVLIVAESSRQIASLAPVLVNNARQTDLVRLWKNFNEMGVDGRVGWLADNILSALRSELRTVLPRGSARKYKKAEMILRVFLSAPFFQGREARTEDILDPDIVSQKTLDNVRSFRSEISKKWQIVTRIQPSEFISALRSARDNY